MKVSNFGKIFSVRIGALRLPDTYSGLLDDDAGVQEIPCPDQLPQSALCDVFF